MRLHILGLAHTKTSKAFLPCAYTGKVFRLCQMMVDRGYTVYHYGAEGSNPVCTENIQVLSDDFQHQVYGDHDWTREMFKFKHDDEAYQEFNRNAIREIRLRRQPGDALLIPMGLGQKAIADALPEMLSVEMGIGYNDRPYAKAKVFESYAWMNYQLGRTQPQGAEVDFYTTVIPNYFDADDFDYREKKGDYFLYMGRVIPKKGVAIAIETTRRIGAKLKVVGQGSLRECGIAPQPHVEEFPAINDIKTRSYLLGEARGVFVPTLYLEPFGGVAVEAGFCGTPVITTDFGAFTETVIPGLTGYRCTSMQSFQRAAETIEGIRPENCLMHVYSHYSTRVVARLYDRFFRKIQDMEADKGTNWLKTWQDTGMSLVSEKVLTGVYTPGA